MNTLHIFLIFVFLFSVRVTLAFSKERTDFESFGDTFDLLVDSGQFRTVNCRWSAGLRAYQLIPLNRFDYKYEKALKGESVKIKRYGVVYSPPHYVLLRVRGNVSLVDCDVEFVVAPVSTDFVNRVDYELDFYAEPITWTSMPSNGYPLVTVTQHPNICVEPGAGEMRAFKLVYIDGLGHVKMDFRYSTHEGDANVRIIIPGLSLGMSAQGFGWRLTEGFSEFGYIPSAAAWFAVNRDGQKRMLPCGFMGENALLGNSVSETAPVGIYSVRREGLKAVGSYSGVARST